MTLLAEEIPEEEKEEEALWTLLFPNVAIRLLVVTVELGELVELVDPTAVSSGSKVHALASPTGFWSSAFMSTYL
jgi:hypothetical protein